MKSTSKERTREAKTQTDGRRRDSRRRRRGPGGRTHARPERVGTGRDPVDQPRDPGGRLGGRQSRRLPCGPDRRAHRPDPGRDLVRRPQPGRDPGPGLLGRLPGRGRRRRTDPGRLQHPRPRLRRPLRRRRPEPPGLPRLDRPVRRRPVRTGIHHPRTRHPPAPVRWQRARPVADPRRPGAQGRLPPGARLPRHRPLRLAEPGGGRQPPAGSGHPVRRRIRAEHLELPHHGGVRLLRQRDPEHHRLRQGRGHRHQPQWQRPHL